MKIIKLSLLMLSISASCIAQSSTPLGNAQQPVQQSGNIIHDKNAPNSVFNKNDQENNAEINATPIVNVTFANEEHSSSVYGSANQVVLMPAVKDENKNETYQRKTKTDIPTDFSGEVKVAYTRKSNIDIPVDYSTKTKDNYVRDKSVKELNAGSKTAQINANNNGSLSSISTPTATGNDKNRNPNTVKKTVSGQSSISTPENVKNANKFPVRNNDTKGVQSID